MSKKVPIEYYERAKGLYKYYPFEGVFTRKKSTGKFTKKGKS